MGTNRRKRLPAFLLAVCLLLPFLPQGSHASFSDVQDQWFAPAVEEMAQRGLIGGFPDGTFRPGDWVKRGEGAKMTAQAVGQLPYTLPQTGKGDFADLNGHWSAKYVRQLLVEEIIEPEDYGTDYGPNQKLTRLEMVRMLLRLLGFTPSDTWEESGFPDLVSLNAEDRYYCEKAVEIGLIQGYSDGLFRPDYPLSRAQAAVMFQRALPLATVSVAGLSAYGEARTIPQAAEFFPVVENSQVSGQGEYQGRPLSLYRHTLTGWEEETLEEGLKEYERVLAYQQYTLVEESRGNGVWSLLFADLRGSQCLLLVLREKEGDTGLPSLTAGLWQQTSGAENYAAFCQSLGCRMLFFTRGMAPSRFLPLTGPEGQRYATEWYDAGLLPAGASQWVQDALKSAGYEETGETILLEGREGILFQKEGAQAAVCLDEDYLTLSYLPQAEE
ncbi:S-layer homology domain-containing protein [Intestinimonas butyriciproducens]|uniref:S-layer homology domain-containing protein n=1 Tax=Intestinimonas butyriciproducens TaxID=1297617 RepID=UPI001957F96A|nr:S-layer homology domain-containing protein [Intestinimonas butyriciproducens]MBM6917583.1 S-layer homology domain-containing protein [Intestinimonas butyriciproducens]